MKNLARCFLLVLFMGLFNNTYAQEWVSYQPQMVVQPVIQYQVYQPQPVIVYQWVPIIVQQNVLTENYCLFHKTQTLTSVPQIRYVLQPVTIYR